MQPKMRSHIATSPVARGATPLMHIMAVARYDAHNPSGQSEWAERTGRHYQFFNEYPPDHWRPADGIGAVGQNSGF